jgi:hypothetical protein
MSPRNIQIVQPIVEQENASVVSNNNHRNRSIPIITTATMPPHVDSEQVWDMTVESTNVPLHQQQEKSLIHSELLISSTSIKKGRGVKSVQFKDTTTFREILPLSEISDDEMAEVWYNEDDYAEIKGHVTDTIRRVSNGEPVGEEDGYCMRGLEGRTKFGARRRKNNKAKALDAVWTTQVKLWKQRIDNPLVIAAAYKPHSTNAKYPAISVAHDDEKFVRTHIRGSSIIL